MTTEGKDFNENERITKVLSVLKSFAVVAEVPTVIISQMARAKDKGNPNWVPSLDELRGSGSLEQDAMTVTFVYKDRKATLSEHIPECMYRCDYGPAVEMPTASEAEIRNMITPVRWRLAKNHAA